MDAIPAEQEPEIRAQVVKDLYLRSRPAIIVLLIMVAVIRWALEPVYQADGRLRLLFLVLIVVCSLRLALVFIPAERRDRLSGLRTQYAVFAAGVLLTSCTLGAIMFIAWPRMEVARIATLVVITSGLVSGAIGSLGFSPLVYQLYLIPPVGVMFIRALTDTRPPWGAEILATGFAIYALAVTVLSLDQRRTRREAICLSLTLADLVMRDALTRLHNRRFLQDLMPRESARLARDFTDLAQGRQPERDSTLGVYLLDLDYFKNVNDAFGHAAGDALLKQTARILTATLRRSDHLVRWGGEEFVAVTWLKQRGQARVVAEKLRRAIEAAEFAVPDGPILRKTVSVGFCTMPFAPSQPDLVSWEQALAFADAALYLAKAEGRNRWVGLGGMGPAWSRISDAAAEALRDLAHAEAQELVWLERSSAAPACGPPAVPAGP